MSESTAATDLKPQLRRIEDADAAPRLALHGMWNLRHLAEVLQPLAAEVATCARDPKWQWDLRAVTQIDDAGAMLLWRAWGRQRPENLLLRAEHEVLFERLYTLKARTAATAVRDWMSPVVMVGGLGWTLYDHLRDGVALIGRVVLDALYLVQNPQRIPGREISASLFRTGVQALGITALVGFLIGIVLSYLSAKQLRMFGADIFIINILGISVIRELGPLLAAILVAGRSGSSMTAQLGVMRMNEELDALTVMGIPYSLRLVLPKIIGLGLAMPLIVLWTSSVALFGGMVAANLQLGIGFQFFFEKLPSVVPIANLWLGVGKGVVFGMLIALVACHYGLRIKPNTESLGVGTTNAVVAAITIVIIVDAIFAVAFSDVGMR